MPYQATEGAETETADLWLMFLSIESSDYWISYGVVDDLTGEPQDSLNHNNVTELKKLSIIIGDRWKKIEKFPAQTSARHSELASDIEMVNDVIMEMSFTELQEHRTKIDWEGTVKHWQRMCGMILSKDTSGPFAN